jgi:thiol-disulfide isomerase/thioredoxin
MRALTVTEAPPPMPVRPIRGPDGAETTLAAVANGQPTVLNIWATWCAPCIEEMPTLGALQRHFAGRLRVIAVSVDSEGDLDRARAALADLSQGALPLYADITRGIVWDVDARGMPVTIIYDRDGLEIARLVGGADWASDDAIALVEATLAEGAEE